MERKWTPADAADAADDQRQREIDQGIRGTRPGFRPEDYEREGQFERAKARVEAGDVSFDAIAALANADAMRLLAKAAEPIVNDLHDQLSDVRQALFERTRLMDAMQDERDEYRDLLKDILDCEAEERAIGGGPGWRERREKAFAAGWERFSG